MSYIARDPDKDILILGGGLTGLTAGCVLSQAGYGVKVFERDPVVGGLSKTVIAGEFRFDLGGHRFFTKDRKIDAFVKDLMGDELVSVPRKSKIFMRAQYFDYPLKPLNAMLGLGIGTSLKIVADYGTEKVMSIMRKPSSLSLEDWVVNNFGRTMFDIYFKEYSEKVWGIDCSRISVDWVTQRIRGLSLGKAIKNAFFRLNGKDIPSLVDRFVYPELGIGRISDRLSEEISKNNAVFTSATIEQIGHNHSDIEYIRVNENGRLRTVSGKEVISTIPFTGLVKMLSPVPPERIVLAAQRLRFRDLVIVAVMVDRERVTDQTWIYIPEKKIPFGRIHEPTNWSRKMAPPGKTLLVAEFFSFAGDAMWSKSDRELAEITVSNLENLGFLKRNEVLDSSIVRVPRAYPLFEIGYRELCDEIYGYLDGFSNLHIAGRSGMFRYYNMDHAIESGITTAEGLIANNGHAGNRSITEDLVAGNKVCDAH